VTSRTVTLGLLSLVCAALIASYAIGFAAPGFDVYNDDGIYLVTAKALAEGSGYKIISLPEPIAQTKYPPAFPLALAAVWKIIPRFPQNIYALKMVPFGFALAWLWLVFIYLREKLEAVEPAAWIVLFSVASPWVLFSSVAFMSETMFAFFLTAALVVIDRVSRADRPTWSSVLLASALAAAAILTRTAGLPLILAGAGALIIRKKIGSAVAFVSSVCAAIAPSWLWSMKHLPAPGSFEAYYSGLNYIDSTLTWSQRLGVIGTNVAIAIISPGGLMGFFASSLGLLLSMALAAIVLYGFVLDLKKGITSLNLFVLLYEGMLLLWRYSAIRFWGPVLPFLLYFAYLGVVDLLSRIRRVSLPSAIGAYACAVLLLPFAGYALLGETLATLRNGSAVFPLAEQRNWPATVSAMHWVSRSTPAEAVLLGDGPTIFLLTGRRGIDLFSFDPSNLRFPFGTPSQFVAGILQAKVDYAMYEADVIGAQSLARRDQIEKAVSDHPSAFAAVGRGQVSSYVIYSIDRNKLEAEAQ
jgi:hypothetical protein